MWGGGAPESLWGMDAPQFELDDSDMGEKVGIVTGGASGICAQFGE